MNRSFQFNMTLKKDRCALSNDKSIKFGIWTTDWIRFWIVVVVFSARDSASCCLSVRISWLSSITCESKETFLVSQAQFLFCFKETFISRQHASMQGVACSVVVLRNFWKHFQRTSKSPNVFFLYTYYVLPRLDKIRESDLLPLLVTESIIMWMIIERQSATAAFGAQDKAGLYPFTSITVSEAPFSSNVWVTTTNPFLAAICNGLIQKR